MIDQDASWSICPGCGVRLRATGTPPDAKRNCSAECWQLAGEVTGFELQHTARLGRFHQLTVDAYGAQHADNDGSGIRVAYSLVGLYLALERRMNGLEVRSIHQIMGKPQGNWPKFPRPSNPGEMTVLDVAAVGVRAQSVDGHEEAVQRWAGSVWHAWSDRHRDVEELANRWAPPP